MKIITGMRFNFPHILWVFYKIQQDKISYPELIRFFYGETPPNNHNFLRYDYEPFIETVQSHDRTAGKIPTFSIIVSTYNRSGFLKNALDSLTKQKKVSSEDYEIIIVDNGSQDKTGDFVRKYAGQKESFHLVYIRLKENYGADFARNIAALHSRGQFLAFTDDDCVVPPTWLFNFKKDFELNPSISASGGFKEPFSVRGKLDIYHRFSMWMFLPPPETKPFVSSGPYNPCGLTANVCYSRKAFFLLGGFNIYFKHMGFYEFRFRMHRAGFLRLYNHRMVKHFADFNLNMRVRKGLVVGWDFYLLSLLYPDIQEKVYFHHRLRRSWCRIRSIFTKKACPPFFMKTTSEIISFSFLSILDNLLIWFGKYWAVFAFRRNPRLGSHSFLS